MLCFEPKVDCVLLKNKYWNYFYFFLVVPNFKTLYSNSGGVIFFMVNS